MLSNQEYFLRVFSSLSVIAPIILGLVFFRRTKGLVYVFLYFLIFGLFIDLGGWFFYKTKNIDASWVNRYIWDLVEPIFVVWFISKITQQNTLKKACSTMMFVFGGSWLITTLSKNYLGYFRTMAGIILAFISAAVVLELIEKRRGRLTVFSWIMLGMFFYFFNTFFIMAFINSKPGLDIWWLQNAINITTNIIYAVGFWVCRDEFATGKLESQSLSNT